MQEIFLSKGYVSIVDDCDYEWAASFNWSALVTYKRNDRTVRSVYAQRSEYLKGGDRRFSLMHREIMNVPREARFKIQVDHRDGDGLNNRRSNLRVCTPFQNHGNSAMRSDNTTGYRGVCWDKDRALWIVQFRCKVIGRFGSIKEAALAYNEVTLRQLGEFASLNEVPLE
jgi:HNH endonuclease